ncbi:hypothetical protein F0562_001057 [Nyssa sinensis]|uniref:Uncharacterized protein n=1 Tax=Nyssa sinensis TaxID=561372 RepID=A0A5J5C1V9_9ASTE|nr:hypothetical protein F0562_001057 [Nyssa sinensis]
MSGTTDDVPVVLAEAPRGRESGRGGKKTREQSRICEEQASLEGRMFIMENVVGEMGERLERHQHNFEALEGYMMGEMEQIASFLSIPSAIAGVCRIIEMASLNIFFSPMVATGRVYAATAEKSSGGSSEEKGLWDWIIGGLQKEDQLLETDPILKKVEEKNGGTTGRKNSVAVPPKKSGGFGGLFAKN